jgi:hypothetical protein
MRDFTLNLTGRIKNFPLPKNRQFVPLYEAVVNSLHAVEERRGQDASFKGGNIDIAVVRSQQMSLSNERAPITGFIVSDDGIGFTERNMNSFMDSDSTYKEKIGGKGVGRFSWLKAFQSVLVSSVYAENGSVFKREFSYSIDGGGIDDEPRPAEDGAKQKTTVYLESYLAEYATADLPKNLETVATRIMQHCLAYFLDEQCPKVCVHDDFDIITLNRMFRERVAKEENASSLVIDGKGFSLLHVKVTDKSFAGNRLYLCANNRLVRSEELDRHIVDLDKQIFEKGRFWYIGVLTSPYLDEHVEMNRLSFNIPDNNATLSCPIAMDTIFAEACNCIKEYLQSYLAPIAEEKNKRIRQYATAVSPQFRHLLKYAPEKIARIKPNLSDEQLDDALRDIKRAFDKQCKKEQRELLARLDDANADPATYEQLFQAGVKKISDANSAVLAEYVTHRRVIIELLERGLRKQSNGSFNLEKYMHELVYPMRKTSEELDYEAHNLWLLDERLAYCGYISSDVPFNNDPRESRTDILVLDRPVAVSDNQNDGTVFDTIVVFELKRPMRDNYKADDNPIDQLYDYVQNIRGGKAKDKNGRPISVSNTTKYYLYAVCDVTSSLQTFVEKQDFAPTPDGLGYYRFNQKFNAYFEILSYDKILNNAKKRNRILFEKLGVKF